MLEAVVVTSTGVCRAALMTSEMAGASELVATTVGLMDCSENNSLNSSQLDEWLQVHRHTGLVIDRAITPLWSVKQYLLT